MGSRVVRVTLDGWVEPDVVMSRFGGDGDVVWIDAGSYENASDPSPRESLIGWGSTVLSAHATEPGSVDYALRMLGAGTRETDHDSHPLGWWGWLGYGAGAELLAPGDDALARALGDPEHPDLALLEVDRAIVFSPATGVVTVVHDDSPSNTLWASEVRESLVEPCHSVAPVVDAVPAGTQVLWASSEAQYRDDIERCLGAIGDGDAYQLCLTTQASVPLAADQSALDLYRRLRLSSPAPCSSFVRIGDVTVLGASPERFLTVDSDGVVSTSPIKGTRPRGTTPDEDARLATDLEASDKERAENLMIVDLMRNDLSRVCEPSSVRVTELLGVHTYEHVHQLVSTVTGVLRQGATGVDAVRAAFPPGSMTGAPKRRAVELLAAWESTRRGLYAGAIGRFGRDGSIDLAVVIRSIVVAATPDGVVARIGVGGGITASSIIDDEIDEVRTKARALLEVLGVG